MRVVIADPDIDIDLARAILEPTGATTVFEYDGWSGEDVVAIVVSPLGSIRARELENCPNLKIVATTSKGVDNIDVELCRLRSVAVWHPLDYCSDEVADTAMALLLSLLRGTVFLDRSVRDGQWHYAAAGSLKRIDETRLGVLGYGIIGRKVAARARGLNIAVSAYDPYVDAEDLGAIGAGIKIVELEELFTTSSAISVHVPLDDSTRGLISTELLELMPQGSVLINLARGEIVDINAVLDALYSGRLYGAALDVLDVEPPSAESPAPQHPRLVVTPHAGWYSERSARALFREPLEVIRDVLLFGRDGHVDDLRSAE